MVVVIVQNKDFNHAVYAVDQEIVHPSKVVYYVEMVFNVINLVEVPTNQEVNFIVIGTIVGIPGIEVVTKEDVLKDVVIPVERTVS